MTPDHRSTTAQRSNQISLPGQTHVADGPHDQTGMYLMHHAFRRDLAAFEQAVAATPVTDEATWRALARRWGRFAEVLHHHHVTEDESIWPVLVRHAHALDDRAALDTLTDMEAEHAEVDPALTACAAAFGDMAAHPCGDHRTALSVRVGAVRSRLLDHLAHEETGALPFLQQVMTAEEYAETERAAQRAYPSRLMPFLVAWVSDGVPHEVVRRVIDGAGPGPRLALRLCRPWYDRGERRAFRYVRPA